MAIKLKIPKPRDTRGKGRGKGGLLGNDPLVRLGLLGFLTVSLVVIGVFVYGYVKYDRIIEQRFRGPVFASSAKIYAAPQVVKVGSKQTVSEIAAELRHAGYTDGAANDGSARKEGSPLGSYRVHGASSIEVLPGPESYHSPEPATIN